MEMTGEYRIPAARERVWEALNDPAVLKECIPGCESLEASADNEFKATVRTKIGPVSARFSRMIASMASSSSLPTPDGAFSTR